MADTNYIQSSDPPVLSHTPADSYQSTTDPRQVDRPVNALVHPALAGAWRVNHDCSMPFIFDAVNPAMKFKRSMPDDGDESSFPTYESGEGDDMTETDAPPPGLKQYMPKPYRMRTRLQCDLTVEQFMSWTAGELRVFAIGHKGRKKNQPFVYKYRQILAPYDRLIAQLIAEVRHGGLHDTHETRRRKSYAGEVLDRFVSEFEGYTESEATFRSKVLTPILQRQLIGITDAYMIPTRRAIACGDGDPTIAQVTSFYLGVDPTDPRLIPQYRFNMAFIPEMRWHLATVLDVIKVGSFDSYNKIRCADQDTLLAAIKENAAYLPRRRLPILEEAMIHVLEMEGIDTFFREEIEHARNLGNTVAESTPPEDPHPRKRAASSSIGPQGSPGPTSVALTKRPCQDGEGSLLDGEPNPTYVEEESDDRDVVSSDPDNAAPSQEVNVDSREGETEMGQPSAVESPRIDSREVGEDPHRLSNLDAGCIWDAENYSCAYDVVFMAFYGMYGLSSSTWRTRWRGESPDWNGPLGDLFDELLSASTQGKSTPNQTSQMLSTHRNTFRQSLRQFDPSAFGPGPVLASAVRILEILRSQPPSIPSLYQDLICTGCATEKSNAWISLSFLGEPVPLKSLLRTGDPQPLPLQVALSRLIERYTAEPHPSHGLCNVCKAPRLPTTLRFSERTWTWFELTSDNQSLLPSLEIAVPQVISRHTLQAIVYLGDSHFTARIRKGANTWWSYDSQLRNGSPIVETIATEEGLRTFGERVLAFLIYRCYDAND